MAANLKSAFSKIPRPLKILSLFFLLSMIHLYPLLKNFFTMLPYATNGDVGLSLSILYSNIDKLSHLQIGQIYHLPFLFPLSYTLTIGFTLFGQSLLLLPVFLLGTPNIYPLYNTIIIFSYLSAGYAAYLFFKELVNDEAVSIIAAGCYLLLPFRVYNLAHLNMLFNFPIPLCFLFLLRYFKKGRPRDLVYLNLALFSQFLFDLSLGFYLSISLALFVLVYVLITRPFPRRDLLKLFISLLPTMAAVLLVHAPFLRGGLSLSPSEPSFNPEQYLPALSFYANKSTLLLILKRLWDIYPLFPGFAVIIFFFYAFSAAAKDVTNRILLGVMVGAYAIPGVIAVVFFGKSALPRINALSEIGLGIFFASLALLLWSARKDISWALKIASFLVLAVVFMTFNPFPGIFDLFNSLAKFLPFLHRSRALRTQYILPLFLLAVFAFGLKAFLEKKGGKKIYLWVIALILLVEHFRWPAAMAELPGFTPSVQESYELAAPYPDHYGMLELPFLAAPSNIYAFLSRFHPQHTYHGYYLSYSDPLHLEGRRALDVETGMPGLNSPDFIQMLKSESLNLILIQASFIPFVYDGDHGEIWQKIRRTIQSGRDMGLYRDVRETSSAVLIVLDDGRKGTDVEYPIPYFALAGRRTIQFRLQAEKPAKSRIYFNGRLMEQKDVAAGEQILFLDIRTAPKESQINRLRVTSDQPVTLCDVRLE